MMSKNRGSCPPNLEKKLNREVHYTCPICGSFPLVRAHTTKTYTEVGWDYDYLLAICGECEKRVEKNEINRDTLQIIKNRIKKSISEKERTRPYQIPLLNNNDVYLGNIFIRKANIVIAHNNLPIIWIENHDGVKTLNARFYDFKGSVINAIDKNMWTADRKRFYDFKVSKKSDIISIEIIGIKDDTHISLSISNLGISFGTSKFYLPNQPVQISSEGDLTIGSNRFTNIGIINSNIAFSL